MANGSGGYLVITKPWPAMLRTIWGMINVTSTPIGRASRAGTSPATGRRNTRTATSGCLVGSTT